MLMALAQSHFAAQDLRLVAAKGDSRVAVYEFTATRLQAEGRNETIESLKKLAGEQLNSLAIDHPFRKHLGDKYAPLCKEMAQEKPLYTIRDSIQAPDGLEVGLLVMALKRTFKTQEFYLNKKGELSLEEGLMPPSGVFPQVATIAKIGKAIFMVEPIPVKAAPEVVARTLAPALDPNNEQAIREAFRKLATEAEKRAFIADIAVRRIPGYIAKLQTHEDWKRYAANPQFPKNGGEERIVAIAFTPFQAVDFYFAKIANGDNIARCVYSLRKVVGMQNLRNVSLARKLQEAAKHLPSNLQIQVNEEFRRHTEEDVNKIIRMLGEISLRVNTV